MQELIVATDVHIDKGFNGKSHLHEILVELHQAGQLEPAKAATGAKKAKPVTETKKMGVRYFEFVSGKSSKFWEIFVDAEEVTVRYGRIGSNGTTKVKSFPDEAAAGEHVEKLIAEKTKKGYVEK